MIAKVELARGGPRLSRMVAGMWRLADWRFDQHELAAYIERCLELGITSFDHADIYGDYRCEGLFGRWLADNRSLRGDIQLVSKCGIKLLSARHPAHRVKHYDQSAAHIVGAVENSLRALNTDYLDLLLLHRPDPLMQADEVAEAFADLERSGKVRHFGVSNFPPAQFALLASRFALVTNQVECSLLQSAPLFDGTFDQCQERAVAPMIWSPLAAGALFDERAPRALRTMLVSMAERYGASEAAIAYAWLLRHPARLLPIVGSRRLAVLDEAAAACAIELERQDWFALLEAARGTEVA